MENVLPETSKTPSKTDQDFYIVGIGSSAGGLKALEEFFDYCPLDTEFAFIIIQHLSPDYKSIMSELLSRHTKMSVKEAVNDDVVIPNHVYLIPGNKNIEIKGGKLKLSKRPPSTQINFSIDLFFKSLALEKKEKSLAIILSGTGSDGTKGAKAIKEIGGTVLVQSPDSSDFDGMPNSVILQGLADYVLEPNEMAQELIDFVSRPGYATQHQTIDYNNNEESLHRILKIIKNHIGYDFFSYKKPTLFRRTTKRISITKCQTVEDYIDHLYEHPNEKFLLTQEFLIGVTKFFRDAKAFEILEKQIIPAIVASKKEGESIKIWVVACSSGEEAYSITILLEKYLRKMKLKIPYKVFATDLDERGIEVATKGVYNTNISSEVPPELLQTYFIKKDNQYIIHPDIRKSIIFSKHDVLQNPPFNKMDLVSCRNMLIYMENTIQLKVLSSFHYALNLHGFLFLGSSENLGPLGKNFEEVSGKWKIYKNIEAERLINTRKNEVWRIEREGNTRFHRKQSNTLEDKIAKSINKLLMDELSAVSICIDENFEIIHATGKLKQYIHYPEEGYSNNILKMLPDELNIPIATAVRKLSLDTKKTIEKKVRLLQENSLKSLRLIICAFNIVSVSSRSYLITIIEESKKEVTPEDDVTLVPKIVSNTDQLLELKEALSETRENLQSTIEELETSNEEMQATNEELLASNEELQSTNEELQSLNEELHAVNAELQEKNEQLTELNSDIENLMKNINIGTMFLDKQFQIRKFTPSINTHFQLRSEDIGRSIAHFSGTLGGEDLIVHAKEVIRTLVPFHKDIVNSEGQWFSMQIFPYRNQRDTIQGVVINFVHIHEFKAAIEETEKVNRFLTHITNSNPTIIYIYDIIHHKNVYASSNIWETAGYSPEDIKKMGNNVLETIIHPDDLKAVYEHQKQLAQLDDQEEKHLEYRLIHKHTKEKIWILTVDKVYERDADGTIQTILGVAILINQYKEIQQQLNESEERYRLAIKGIGSALWEWSDLDSDKAWWSDKFYTLLGYTRRSLKPHFTAFTNLIHAEHKEKFDNGLKAHIEQGTPFEEDIKIRTKKNGYRWFRVNAQILSNNTYSFQKITGTLLDITDRKESQRKMQELNIELERFAYLASHDLKEPLRTVTSFTKLFKEEYESQFDDMALQYLSFIENASARMITLTNDLLVYSQLDDKSLHFEPIVINDIIQEVVEDLQNTIQLTHANIIVHDLPTIVCDALQIKQLFQNLIANSLKYCKEPIPKVEIGYRNRPVQTEFYVRDNGIGIPKKYLTQIFEVFKRLHSQSEYEGTGIGLANCKRIVDNHNGTIWVQSTVDEGSTFLFTIPKKT